MSKYENNEGLARLIKIAISHYYESPVSVHVKNGKTAYINTLKSILEANEIFYIDIVMDSLEFALKRIRAENDHIILEFEKSRKRGDK